MLVTSVAEACPLALQEAVQEARSLSDVFETVRPLAFHCECFVSLARCVATQQQLVIKSYLTSRMSDRAKQQVSTEMRVQSRLSHPTICGFLLAFEDSQHVYLATQYAEGGDLRALLESGPVPEAKTRDFLVIPLLQALTELHVQGVIHRDIKPANVLIQDGAVRLADFGLAMYAAHPVNPPLEGLVSHRSSSSKRRHFTNNTSNSSGRTDPANQGSGGADAAVGNGNGNDSCSSAVASDSEGDDCTSHDPTTPRAAGRMYSGSCSAADASHGSISHAGISNVVIGLGGGSSGASGRVDSDGCSIGGGGLICGKSRIDNGQYCSTATAAHASAGGTPLYAAPEVLLAMFQDPRDVGCAISHHNDVWALGIMALEAVSGAHPFSHNHSANENLLYAIAHHSKLVLPDGLSEEAADWLSQALQRDPKERPTAEVLLQHPWMTKEYSDADGPAALRCVSALSCGSLIAEAPECWEY